MQCILYFNIHYWAWCVMLPMLCFVESSKQLLSVVVSASWPVCETTSPRAGNYGDGVFVSCLVTGFRTILILGTGQIHGVDFDWSRWSRDCTNVSVKIWTVLLLYCDDTVSQYCLRVQFRAFQAGMVQGRNAYLNTSTVGWKRWNCLGWPLAEFCRRGTGWYSCGTSTSPFVILYIMVSLLWSLRVCRGSHPRSDTIADTETGGLLRRKGMFFTNRAARRCVFSSLSIYFC